jgi:hypothetical protein
MKPMTIPRRPGSGKGVIGSLLFPLQPLLFRLLIRQFLPSPGPPFLHFCPFFLFLRHFTRAAGGFYKPLADLLLIL